tara:strand:+ start:71 stop:757 length:687 start_codon:yes stop_codon:yes gene_type:complete
MKQSKISGGAYKYIQKFYGENDMSYPGGMPGPGKLSEAQSRELDSNKDGELTGSDFKSLGSSKMGDPDPKKKGQLDGVTGIGTDKTDPDSRKKIIADGVSIKKQRLANQKRGVLELRKQKSRDSLNMDMDNPTKAKNAFDFSIYPRSSRPNSGGMIEYKSSSRKGNSNERAFGDTSDSNIQSNVGEDTNYKGEYYNSEKSAQIKKFKNLLGKNANTGANKIKKKSYKK